MTATKPNLKQVNPSSLMWSLTEEKNDGAYQHVHGCWWLAVDLITEVVSAHLAFIAQFCYEFLWNNVVMIPGFLCKEPFQVFIALTEQFCLITT